MLKNKETQLESEKKETTESEGSGSVNLAKESTISNPKKLVENTAGFWIRLQALLIDGLLIMIVYLLPLFVLFKKQPNLTTVIPTVGVILYVNVFVLPLLAFLYHVLTISKLGGSLGKLLSGIKVVHEDGKYLSIRQSIFRYVVGYFVSGLLFGTGYLWIFKDKRHQGWHDQISGTFVVFFNRSIRYLATMILIILLVLNGILVVKTFESIRDNIKLQDEINILIVEIKELLENENPPATIEPQDTPLII